jgi:hypothetical protein
MAAYTMEMEAALACVDTVVAKLVFVDTDPVANGENKPPVVETGKLARKRAGMSSEAQLQLDAAIATFDEHLGGKQVGLRLEQVEVFPMVDLVSLDRLDELRELQFEAAARNETFFPKKDFFPLDGYELLIKHHLTAAAYALFDAHVTRHAGCFTDRYELDEDAKKKHHFEHTKKNVAFTRVLVSLEARNAFESATGDPRQSRDLRGLVSP